MGAKVRVKRGHYYLDIYHNGARRWESLHMTRTGNAQLDREMDRLAEICRAKREMQILSGEYNVTDRTGGRVPLYDYIAVVAEEKNAKRNYVNVLPWIEKYQGGRDVRLNQVDEAWIVGWQHFLAGTGLSNATQRHYEDVVRTTLNQAVRERRIIQNPAKAVKGIAKIEKLHDVLTEDDLEKLVATPISSMFGSEIKRAFLFGVWTGLRVSDIRTLQWNNIEQNKIRLVMHKTKQVVEIPLHPMAAAQLEKNNERLVFPWLGRSKTNCMRYFAKWARDACVNKKIGWHTARRTFATLSVEAGVDQYVISKLLGHTTMTHTAVYSQVPITVKRTAVAKLPDFGLLK